MNRLPNLAGRTKVPLNPFQEDIRRLRRFILTAFILGGLVFSMLTATISLYLHTQAVRVIAEQIKESIEKEFQERSSNEVMVSVLSNRKVVNSLCNKWWFEMDHSQRRVTP